MALFRHGVLGKPKGKIGNQVFRHMNGKIFVSNRPDSYNISQTAQAKASRKGFGLVVKFAKLINSSPELAECWKKAKIAGTSPYHKIIKHNLSKLSSDKLTINNIITPHGFSIGIDENALDKSVLLLSLDSSRMLDGINNPKTSLHNVLFLYEPVFKKYASYDFIIFSTKISPADYKSKIEVSIELNKTDSLNFNRYKKSILYSAVVAFDEKNKLYWSSTVAKELN